MNFKRLVCIYTSLICLSAASVLGTPLRLKIEPEGTNSVRITLAPLVPGALYGVMARTNGPDGYWLRFAGPFFGPSNGVLTATWPLGGPGELAGLRPDTLKHWKFVAGWEDDVFGDGLPRLYKELVLRTDPFASADPYAMPAGDGWTILQKMQNNWDPLGAYLPPQPRLSVRVYALTNSAQARKVVLTIENTSGVLPDYIDIERATRTVQQPAEEPQFERFYPGPRYDGSMTNRPPFPGRMPFTNRFFFTNRQAYMNRPWLTNRPAFTNRPGFTNRPPFLNRPAFTNRPSLTRAPLTNQPSFARPPVRRPWPAAQPTVVTGPYEPLATITTKPGVQTYTYVDTYTDTFTSLQPEYRIRAHFVPPFRASLTRIDTDSIRKSILSVRAQPTTNGYALVVEHPVPYARYLLLVRDQRDPQWRASGYFCSGTNRAPVSLHVDSKGMMSEGQSPIAMSPVKFLPEVVQPEFTAGSGEDSDGDGLPDVYEVLTTKTDPANADTGETGVLDGYKEMSGDGWSTLEKFRRRLDPLKAHHPPSPRVLTQPTLAEAIQAFAFRSDVLYPPQSEIGTDLPYQPQVEIRIPGTAQFQVLHRGFWLLYGLSSAKDASRVRGCFDLRISWVVPQPHPHEHENEADAYSALAFSGLGAEALRGRGQLLPPGQTNLIAASRSDVEAYAATHKQFGAAMDYFLATIDGRQPAQLPPGTSVQEIEAAVLKVFPGATNMVDRPIRFYGKVVDENNRPVSGFKAHFEWSGALLREREKAETVSDSEGRFSLTNAFGTRLGVSVENPNYYASGRNRGYSSFDYVDPMREAFRPDPNHPVVFYFHKKGVGARALVTSQYGVYEDFTVKVPLDGTPLQVNLIERKTGNGPLQLRQVKPEHYRSRAPTNWFFAMKIPSGGFVSRGDEEFPFHPPSSGYQPEVTFDFDKGQTNWSGVIQKDYYIRFGDPPVYGRLRIETWIDRDSVRLSYVFNPDGERNLEPPNENTPTKPPMPFVTALQPVKSEVLFTNASGQVVVWGSMVVPLVKPGTRFTVISAGGEHSLAVTADGKVVAWGRNDSREVTVPAGLSNVVAVAAGGRTGTGFSVALRREGTVAAWGDNSSGQTAVPPGLSNVIALSAGTDHCLALKRDGTVIGWGGKGAAKARAPAGLSNVVAVAAAGEHSVALKRDGTLVAWGQSPWGQASGPHGLSNVVCRLGRSLLWLERPGGRFDRYRSGICR